MEIFPNGSLIGFKPPEPSFRPIAQCIRIIFLQPPNTHNECPVTRQRSFFGDMPCIEGLVRFFCLYSIEVPPVCIVELPRWLDPVRPFRTAIDTHIDHGRDTQENLKKDAHLRVY